MRCFLFSLLAISSLGRGFPDLLSLAVSSPEVDRKASFDFEASQARPSQSFREPWDLKRDEKKSLADAPNWTLRNVLRKIHSNDRIWLGFHVTSEGYEPEWCYMLIRVQGDPRTAPFTNEPCVGSNFSVSWGYMAENEGGIMTLLNPQGTRNSWFGWNHVNSAEHLNDAGPNPTADVSV